ncbi:MAG: acyltransferase family protein [Pseudomonadota bacterium]
MTVSTQSIGSKSVSAPAIGERVAGERVNWVDTAKGICIIFVVMMHTTLGLEKAVGEQGWMHAIVSFAQPFRMPDFFLISGLFLAATIDRPWRLFLDRKVLHFFYFYVLWLTIQYAMKAPNMMAEGSTFGCVIRTYFFSFIQPFGTLWFIYLLPVFFVVTKAMKNHIWWLFGASVLLQIAPIHTGPLLEQAKDLFGVASSEKGFLLIDEFCSRLVYFLAGYMFASHLFALADKARRHVPLCLALLMLWAVTNGTFVALGWAGLPLVSLVLGFAGGGAIVLCASLIAGHRFTALINRPLNWFGANSIVIYLSFFFPMVVSRLLLTKLTPWLDVGTMSFVSLVIGIVAPMVFYTLVRWTGWGMFLFHRPDWAVLSGTPWKKSNGQKAALQAAQ